MGMDFLFFNKAAKPAGGRQAVLYKMAKPFYQAQRSKQ